MNCVMIVEGWRDISSGEEKMEDKHDLELVISIADTHAA
jgi:hypothetical protein